jgi:hypothetical protein
VIPEVDDVVAIGPECGAQFRACPLVIKVQRVWRHPNLPAGSVYLAGRVIVGSHPGEYRPELLVEHSGLELRERPEKQVVQRRARNAGPARIPQQRTKTTYRSHR